MSSLNPTLVADGIWRLSANAGRDLLFEGRWPLPHGASMNSLCALIDGVCGWDGVPQTLPDQLQSMGVGLRDIRYVVLNHLEPDHTGWLEPLARLHPDFTLCASSRGLGMAGSFYGLAREKRVLATGERLELAGGAGQTEGGRTTLARQVRSAARSTARQAPRAASPEAASTRAQPRQVSPS